MPTLIAKARWMWDTHPRLADFGLYYLENRKQTDMVLVEVKKEPWTMRKRNRIISDNGKGERTKAALVVTTALMLELSSKHPTRAETSPSPLPPLPPRSTTDATMCYSNNTNKPKWQPEQPLLRRRQQQHCEQWQQQQQQQKQQQQQQQQHRNEHEHVVFSWVSQS